jgi:hypothetical protein
MVSVGPVLSHYEFEVLGVNRLSDEDWKKLLWPSPPEWTESYLVPLSFLKEGITPATVSVQLTAGYST